MNKWIKFSLAMALVFGMAGIGSTPAVAAYTWTGNYTFSTDYALTGESHVTITPTGILIPGTPSWTSASLTVYIDANASFSDPYPLNADFGTTPTDHYGSKVWTKGASDGNGIYDWSVTINLTGDLASANSNLHTSGGNSYFTIVLDNNCPTLYIDSATLTLNAPNVVPTPIPAAVWLLGTGLVGLVGLRRKFQK
ncbi:MAG: VPLPA-CTERM sorting domain-containing protein [Syntrophales bacterium]|jgi:hypothetical protein